MAFFALPTVYAADARRAENNSPAAFHLDWLSRSRVRVEAAAAAAAAATLDGDGFETAPASSEAVSKCCSGIS